MAKQPEYVDEWRIENFSHWCEEVHGKCIESPKVYYKGYCDYMELYPRGNNERLKGRDEHLVVRLCGVFGGLYGDLSFYCSNGALLCPKQPVDGGWNDEPNLEFHLGPKFEHVLSRIREGEDFITVRLQIESSRHVNKDYSERRMRTTVNVLKISLRINRRWIEKMESEETKEVFYIQLPANEYHARLRLKTCSEIDTVHFTIEPVTDRYLHAIEYPFAMCMSVTVSDDTVDSSSVKKEHVFRDNSPWTFPNSLEKEGLDGKEISLCLCLTTKNFFQSSYGMSFDRSNVSIEPNNTICISTKEPSMVPVTFNQSEESVAVLTKDLMCLYQNQDFSDFQITCGFKVPFPVHRAILSARSPVFKAMFSNDKRKAASGTVDIYGLDSNTLGLFLTYIYTGAVDDLQCDRALKLYYAADKYQVPSLKKECMSQLSAKVSISNVCDILHFADIHKDDELTSVAYNFLVNNYSEVLESEEWMKLMENEPKLASKTLTQFGQKKHVGKIQ